MSSDSTPTVTPDLAVIAQDPYGQLLCPLCPSDDQTSDRLLYLHWTCVVPLMTADLWEDPENQTPQEAVSKTWQVQCNAGHVIAIPDGDNAANENTDKIHLEEWHRLRVLLSKSL